MAYDNACKFLVEQFPDHFTRWLVGKSIKVSTLQPSELISEPIRADSVIFLQSRQLILHLEFQTQSDPQIPLRMLDYWVRLRKQYPRLPIRQIVVYLRQSRSHRVTQTQFWDGGTLHTFEVIRLWEVDPQQLHQWPGLLPLVVLCQTEDPVAVLRKVQLALESIADPQERANVTAATAVLAGLKLKRALIEQILGSTLMKESVIYQAWVKEAEERGEQRGIQTGIQTGIQAGIQTGIQQVAINLLQTGMDPAQVAVVTGLSLDQLRQLQS
ncbi:MAG: Rpn family recombination-promoting nuclease/putative transposase [Synechococcaceae cyanobacterium SM2_3_2]|nr:Rpn family recombination-promoting nuclease/putative transposase [Synechococcaceae cyanobacterium SM2_3_2]